MKKHGFTVVELIVVLVVLVLLATLSAVGYRTWQKNIAEDVVRSDLKSARSSLDSFRNFNNHYSPNLAGANFVASENVAISMYTDTPLIGVYQPGALNNAQNAQLFLNVCNTGIAGTNNTACLFQGNNNGAKIHVKGRVATNVQWRSPIQESDVILPNTDPAIAAKIITEFKQQGGVFPVIVPDGRGAALPQPTQIPNGPATKFCLEGRSGIVPSIVYFMTDQDSTEKLGTCEADVAARNLHYIP